MFRRKATFKIVRDLCRNLRAWILPVIQHRSARDVEIISDQDRVWASVISEWADDAEVAVRQETK